jgi:FAD/FMN-containing dehydrogenase
MAPQEFMLRTTPRSSGQQLDLVQLRAVIKGDVIVSGDGDYEAARKVLNVLIDRHPTVIVRPVSEDDVAQAVRFARDHALPVAVRAGSHSSAGFGTVDDGVVIDLSRMRTVTIDPEARIARAQGGILAGELLAAASAFHLTAPFGDNPGVGVGGITLGGGVGWLTRKLGMTIDSLLAAEVITADGSKVRASETEHPDLFWALRGGGGNFGVVTTFEFKLHPIDRVLGGTLFLPATHTVLRGLIDLARQAPDDLTVIFAPLYIRTSPVMPQALHNSAAIMVMPVWAGDLEMGKRVLQSFRDLAEPLADAIQPMPFKAMYEGHAEPPNYASIVRAFMTNTLDEEAIDTILEMLKPEYLPEHTAMIGVQIRVLGGAMGRVPHDTTAFSHRDAEMLVGVFSTGFNPAEQEAHQQWVQSLFEAIQPLSRKSYLNFLEHEGENRLREAYSEETYQRLAEVKQHYDPENIFRINHNITPKQA